MKKGLIIFGGLVILIGLIVGGCGWSGIKMVNKITNYQLPITNGEEKLFKVCYGKVPILGNLERWLDNKSYIVLLQNNTELRATGGFPGTYARIEFQNGGLKAVEVENLYQPDGQLPGHVEPPYPIQEAFRQGWWKLRDSNWDPDFASAAATMDWFFREGKEKPFEGIIAINMGLIEEWLKIIGPVKLTTYKETITAENLYPLAQSYADTKTGAETEKREFVGAMGAAMGEKIKGLKVSELWKLAKIGLDQLNKKQILIWVKDPVMMAEVKVLGWDGGLLTGWDRKDDYLYVVDSNLGANKSNCCIEREIKQVKRGKEEKITIRWMNNNPYPIPQPPLTWGGGYYNYARVIVPSTWEVREIIVDGQTLIPLSPEEFKEPVSLRQEISIGKYDNQRRNELRIIGFWARVEATNTIEAVLNLQRSQNETNGGRVWIKRQPGIRNFQYQLVVDGKTSGKKIIDQDQTIGF